MINSYLSSERPTLPSLHSLGLPIPKLPSHELYEYNERKVRNWLFHNLTIFSFHLFKRWTHVRNVSSSTSTSSRTTSPTPSDHSSASSTETARKFRLIPSTLESANAAIVIAVPLPTSTSILPLAPKNQNAKKGKAFLVVGPALRRLQHHQRHISKGAHIRPYRMIKIDHSGNKDVQRPHLMLASDRIMALPGL